MHLDIVTPTKLDERQIALLNELAALRDEVAPAGTMNPSSGQTGIFGRLRDAFNS